MSTSKDKALNAASVDEETAEAISQTMTLATHAFDGANLPDDELDNLCDAVLSDEVEPPKKIEFAKP